MIAYVLPMVVIVVSNIFYQICAKSVPQAMHPMASLTVTYLVGAAASALLYFIMKPGGNLLKEYAHLNWAPIVLGLVIVGLEAGYIYAFQAGWPVSVAQLVQASFLAVALIFVGFWLYQEAITWNKVAGVGVCLVGLWLMNR